MAPSIEFVKTPKSKIDTAVIGVFSDKKLTDAAALIDSVLGGIITHQLATHKTFKGTDGQSLTIALPPRSSYLRVIVLGLGDQKKLDATKAENIGGRLLSALNTQGSERAVFLNAEELEVPGFNLTLQMLLGLRLGSYEFDNYKTKPKKDKDEAKLQTVSILTDNGKKLTKDFAEFEMLAQSIFITRDLVNEPPNKLYPETFANFIKKTLVPLGVKVEIFDKAKIQKLGMGLLYAVGQASEHEPRFVVMSWPGTSKGKKKQKPVALVGKGMTYDSGGLSLKPGDAMVTMKMDMAGAGAVVGAMHMLAKRKTSAPVVAVVPIAENSISDEAYRPDDIITSYSGKTVEVLNTDAEGRLILADALTYVQEKYDPEIIIDLATLTGAILIALGLDYCGVFSNNDDLWTKIDSSAKTTGEKVWRMPLDENFRREMDSPFADIKNIGNSRFGGSSLGAAFLSEFIDKDRPWAHLDIAGVATIKSARPTNPKPFASGYGVRLLNDIIKANYE
ncbi:MAG: leucyl aminopeptidase [Micavibrio aeruginosavorus]|uniref:Probable cytosol aminopeptidase n=1 Tax=Micavibrio aeruginosavorus TaxID=349221 RepID=A0A2W5FGS3_9BACT|nr:MAG: leucyl aminopeptidase [Micavibrio aeruginosavorus]